MHPDMVVVAYGTNDWGHYKTLAELHEHAGGFLQLIAVLETGKTSEIQGFISKAGKPFNARLKLDGDKVVFDF